jgi:hypothetical protein
MWNEKRSTVGTACTSHMLTNKRIEEWRWSSTKTSVSTALGPSSETKRSECQVEGEILQQLSDVRESILTPAFVRYGVRRRLR